MLFRHRCAEIARDSRIAGWLVAAMLVTPLAACSPYRIIDAPSPNHSSRVDYLVIHFTSEDFAESWRLLGTRTDRPVSAHYLIPESGDPTYERGRPLIHRLVPEHRRAWHAGRSAWGDEENLNDRSIGIELVNTSRCLPEEPGAATLSALADACVFRAFDDVQIDLLIHLARDILVRYPGIDPVDIVGHADIAPKRKVDPGPLFPWQRLHDAGIGAWFDDEAVDRWQHAFRDQLPSVGIVQSALRAYGYGLEITGEDDLQYRKALRAFRLHFVPERLDSDPDGRTVATVFALLEKYRPDAFAEVLANWLEDGGQRWPLPAPTDVECLQ
jgi:N-acetyl-anhydromuramyl-L-alanine amidase AmpD